MKHESTRRSILIAFMSFTILFGLATMPTVTSTSPSSPSSFNRALANADVVLATGQNPRGIFYCCGTVAWWNAPKTGSSVGNQFNQVPHTGGAITTDFAAPGVRSFTFFNGFLYFTQQTNGTSAGLVSVDLSNGMKKVLANASSSIGGLFLTFANITPYVYFIADKNI